MYEIQNLPKRGKGLVATQTIPRGTRILSEIPLVVASEAESNSRLASETIKRQVGALDVSSRETFLSLHNIYPYANAQEQYMGMFRTNALPLSAADDQGGICLEACRINHACDNNAVKSWNERIKRHTVHALRDIETGEEITVNYLGTMGKRTIRREKLRSRFSFTRSCNLCILSDDESRKYDEQLEEILALDRLFDRFGIEGILTRPRKMLTAIDRQLGLYRSQHLHDSGFARCFFDAGQVMIINGDQARARIFFESAISEWRAMLGPDGNQVLEHSHLVEAPSRYPLSSRSTRWKTSLHDVPHTMGKIGFDDWLWRRPRLQVSGQHVDLRNRLYFPAFQELPTETLPDPDYHQCSTSADRRPRRHWCFIGEKVEVSVLLRLGMKVRDISGKTLPVIFSTSRDGDEIPARLRKKGLTIMIMYATQRVFKFDDPGIRLEDERFVKVCGCSLSRQRALIPMPPSLRLHATSNPMPSPMKLAQRR